MKHKKRVGIIIIIVAVALALLGIAGVASFNLIHIYEDTITEPTCLEDGYTIRTCKLCKREWRVDEIAALGHLESAWKMDAERTCTQDGAWHTECTVCGQILQERTETAGHAYQLTELIVGKTGMPVAYTCTACGDTYEGVADSKEIGLPILTISGDLDCVSKTNSVLMQVTYTSSTLNFSSEATLKVQGATSASYPKKNYTIKFCKEDGSKNKVSFDSDWGTHSKYCLKANWVDSTQAKNIVSAKLWGQISKTRNSKEDIDQLVNAGAIDGFPVLVYVNDSFYGLYTLNIPKDEWLFGLDDEETKQAVIFQNSWSDSGKLMSQIRRFGQDGWVLEYCSTENSDWAKDSLNDFIAFLNRCDSKESFLNEIEQYTSLSRCMDTMIYTYFMDAYDATSKNMLWVTYDGVRWMPQIYDLDSTWGLSWDGSQMNSADAYPMQGENVLYELLLRYCSEELFARYRELRQTVLTQENIYGLFADFEASVPEIAWIAERTMWPAAPCPEGNDLAGLNTWLEKRIQYFDSLYGNE